MRSRAWNASRRQSRKPFSLLRGTEGSNPSLSRREATANLATDDVTGPHSSVSTAGCTAVSCDGGRGGTSRHLRANQSCAGGGESSRCQARRPENLQNTELGWRRSAETRRARAGALATDLLPIIEAIHAEGITSFGGIAKVLNDRGIPTARGSRWQAVQVQRVVQAATSALAQSGIAPSPSPLSDPKLG